MENNNSIIKITDGMVAFFEKENHKVQKEWVLEQLNYLHFTGILEKHISNPMDVFYFLKTCYDLNMEPKLKEIYPVSYKDYKTGKTSIQAVVDYHQYIKAAEQDPNYNGYTVELIDRDENGKKLPKEEIKAVFQCARKDSPLIFKCVVFLSEEDKFNNWKAPMDMLQKAAIKRGLSRAFANCCGKFDAIEQAEKYKRLETDESFKKVLGE